MVEPLRHRQTKGAATDMFYLTPPRHISTLPIASLSGRPLLFWFLDAGMTNPSTRCGGRRPKSAKARSRGKLGTGWQRVLWRINVEQMSREAVTKRMQRERLAQPRGFLEQPAELTRGQRLMITATWKQPALFWRDAGVVRGRPRLPPLPQQLQDLRWQHHVPVFLSLRLHDADDLLLAVDVARSQPHHLAGPQPATIGQR